MTRDMSKRQFDQACAKHGFKSQGFMGYYQLPPPCDSCRVSVLNAGSNRRAQLAYLLKQYERECGRRGVTP